MLRNFRYRLYPTRGQVVALETQLAWACDLYNAALEQRRTAYRDFGEHVRFFDQTRELTFLREDGDFPTAMNSGAQREILRRLDLAFGAFFRRVRDGEKPGFPRFRSKQRFNTLTWKRDNGGATVVGDRLRIQGVGHIKVKWHRDLPAEPRQTRITRKNGRWYVTFVVEVGVKPLPPTGESIGVDLGVRQFATLSDGTHIVGPRPGRVAAPTIRRAQRKVARRQRGSHRRRKAVVELARRREREANRRQDAAHKAAYSLVDRFDLIVEDLRPSNMVRSGRGLAREITDQGWSIFLQCLEDKAESAGRRVVRVNPRNTSRTCFECGAVDKESRKGPRFDCTTCGHRDDADVNAAKNILALARTGPSGVNANQVLASPEKPRKRRRHKAGRDVLSGQKEREES
jgi:putative transposase